MKNAMQTIIPVKKSSIMVIKRVFILSIPLFFMGLSLSSHTAYAVSGESVTVCRDSPQVRSASSTQKQEVTDACRKGFDAGFTNGNKNTTCGPESGAKEAACNWGFEQGKDRYDKNIAKQAGKQGAIDKKSLNEVCRFRYADNNDVCKKAYKDQATAMAKQAGKDAANNGDQTSAECSRLGLKGSNKEKEAYKKACEKEFKKQKAANGASGRQDCGGIKTYFSYGDACESADKKKGGSSNPIIAIALQIISWLTAMVSVVVVGAIVYGGILYMSARDNSGQTQKAITIIVDAIIGLLLLVGLFLIINFIVPGGLFN